MISFRLPVIQAKPEYKKSSATSKHSSSPHNQDSSAFSMTVRKPHSPQSHIQLHPNPSSFTLVSSYTTNVAIRILDAIGQARLTTPPKIQVTPMAVGQCMNIPSYQGSQTPPTDFVPPTPSGVPSGTRNGNTTFSAPKHSGATPCESRVVSMLLIVVMVVVLPVMVLFA